MRKTVLRHLLAGYFTLIKIYTQYILVFSDVQGMLAGGRALNGTMMRRWEDHSRRFMQALPGLVHIPHEIRQWLREDVFVPGEPSLEADAVLPQLFNAVVEYSRYMEQALDRVCRENVNPRVREAAWNVVT